jgi:hypothetical protein
MYIWKYYKETPCIAIFTLNKEKCHFFSFFCFNSTKLENRRVEQVMPREWGGVGTSSRGGGGRETE